MLKKIILIFFLLTTISTGLFAQIYKTFDLIYTGGGNVPKPADLKKLNGAIHAALDSMNWRIISEEDGKIVARFIKSAARVSVTIEVRYTADDYWITYVESRGLGADLEKMMINHMYIRWIESIIKAVGNLYPDQQGADDE